MSHTFPIRHACVASPDPPPMIASRSYNASRCQSLRDCSARPLRSPRGHVAHPNPAPRETTRCPGNHEYFYSFFFPHLDPLACGAYAIASQSPCATRMHNASRCGNATRCTALRAVACSARACCKGCSTVQLCCTHTRACARHGAGCVESL